MEKRGEKGGKGGRMLCVRMALSLAHGGSYTKFLDTFRRLLYPTRAIQMDLFVLGEYSFQCVTGKFHISGATPQKLSSTEGHSAEDFSVPWAGWKVAESRGKQATV